MQTKNPIFIFICIFLFVIFYMFFFSFNPIKNYKFIDSLMTVLDKLETQEKIKKIQRNNFNSFYRYVNYTNEELDFIETSGIHVSKFNGDYVVKIPYGFDNYFLYFRKLDCWYGDRSFLALEVCPVHTVQTLIE